MRRTRKKWWGCRPFQLRLCTIYCSGNRLKINITPYGESSIIQLTELNVEIWRDTFLKKVLITTEKV